MAAGTRFRPLTLVLLLVAMAGGAFQAFREWRDLWAERHVVLSVAEVVRLHGDRAVVVLTDRSHGRRLPVPVTAQDGTAIERRLRAGGKHSLAARSLEALGARIVRVAIDIDPAGGLCGTLVVKRGVFGTRDVPLETSEALAVALDEGAPIETSLDLLEVAGISEEEARTLALDAARGRAREASSLPVHTF
jgi:bifunctional DNase/RNase